MKKTRTVHGWAYLDETAESLMDYSKYVDIDSILFENAANAPQGEKLKRMTIVLEIRDYEPKRKTSK